MMNIPQTVLLKKEGHNPLVANAEDVEMFMAEGWELDLGEPATEKVEAPSEEDLSGLNRAQLLAKAEELGVEIASSMRKDEIIRAIEEHQS